jgi:hypothetical protein
MLLRKLTMGRFFGLDVRDWSILLPGLALTGLVLTLTLIQ